MKRRENAGPYLLITKRLRKPNLLASFDEISTRLGARPLGCRNVRPLQRSQNFEACAKIRSVCSLKAALLCLRLCSSNSKRRRRYGFVSAGWALVLGAAAFCCRITIL